MLSTEDSIMVLCDMITLSTEDSTMLCDMIMLSTEDSIMIFCDMIMLSILNTAYDSV